MVELPCGHWQHVSSNRLRNSTRTSQTIKSTPPSCSSTQTTPLTALRPWLMTWPKWRSREPTWHPRGPGCGLTGVARGDQEVRIGGTHNSATRAPIGVVQSMGNSSRGDLFPTVKISLKTIIFALYVYRQRIEVIYVRNHPPSRCPTRQRRLASH